MGTLNQMRNDVKAKIAQIKQLRQEVKTLRVDIKREVSINRVVKEDARKAKKAAAFFKKAERIKQREAKKAAQIAKLEARLLAMKSPQARRKANQKASTVKVYSADEIAALNAARA